MAILNRRGQKTNFDPSKMLGGEFGYVLDTAELYYCYSPGNVKRLLTSDDVQLILNASPEAYEALQQLLNDLENNPSELTNILNNISGLQTSKLDKTGDSKDNTSSFTQAVTLSNITSGENHATLFGKVMKFFAFIGTTALTTVAQTVTAAINELKSNVGTLSSLTTMAKTNIVAAINELVSGKIDKVSISTTDTVNDTTKVLGANVGYTLGQEIDTVSDSFNHHFNYGGKILVIDASDVIGQTSITKNSSASADYGTIIEDLNGANNTSTSLVLNDGQLILVKKLQNGTTTQTTIAQL